MKNPFITSGYAGSEYFCDRVQETAVIRDLLENENNVALISPRRLGKTELIHHVFDCNKFRNDYHCFIVDVYATKSLSEFVEVLGKAVLDGLKPKGRKVWEHFLQVVSSIRHEIRFDINGLPSWSVGVGTIDNPSVTLDEIFRYLDEADKPCLIAVDEFQQVTKYNDSSVEAVLRTYVQRTTNAHFIFSGSHRHLMTGIFTSPARPFYQSVTIINLQPIALDKYTEFAVGKFDEAGKNLDPGVVGLLYERFEGITSYIHRVLNVLFSRTVKGQICSDPMVEEAIDFIIWMASDSYESLYYQMPAKQRSLFLAIASEGKADTIKGGPFIKKYGLLSASSVASAAEGLLDKDFITQDRGVFSVYDQFFTLWLKRKNLIP